MRILLLIIASLTIVILSSCAKPVEVDAAKAVRTDVEQTVSSVTSGTVNAEKEAQLAFGAVGRVATLNVQVNSTVKKGDILAEIENQDLRAALAQAAQDLRRAQSLTKSALMAIQENERAKETFEHAHGAYEKSIIRAPFNGLITEVNLEVGELSQITAISPKALIRIIDSEPRYVSADMDEVDLPKINLGLPARVKILAARREPFNGKVRLVTPFVSAAREQDRTSRVELSIESEGILLPPGASADVEIMTAHHQNVLAVPSRLLLGRGNDRFVYKEVSGRALKTPVTIGIGNYEKTEILSGLNENDLVIFPSDQFDLAENPKVKANIISWP